MESKNLFTQSATWTGKWLGKLGTLIKSGGVGLVASISDQASLFLLIYGFGLDEQVANVPSILVGLILMYFGNKYLAFEDHSKNNVKQGGLFVIIEIGAAILNVILFHLFVTFLHWHFSIARAVGTFITYMGFSFPLWAIFVFRKTPKEPDTNQQSDSAEASESQSPQQSEGIVTGSNHHIQTDRETQ